MVMDGVAQLQGLELRSGPRDWSGPQCVLNQDVGKNFAFLSV